VTRTVSYRISAFDKTTLTELNNLRSRANDLLSKFTFPLSDGVRWMPDGVRKLFIDEIKRSDEAGRKRFKEICGTDPEEFVNKKAKQIEEDANRMYQELRPNQFLDSGAIEEILGTLKDRLKEAIDSPFTPKVTSSIVSFEYRDESDQTSAWGQALVLLCAIADFPRKCVSDRHFMRGLRIREEELLIAMNVLDDAFVQDIDTRGIVRRAEEELQTLQNIMHSHAEPQNRCEAILKLIGGQPYHEIVALLPDITANTVSEECRI
ncbi:MAG: hypothetical protein NT023_04855, partial [Armatimonadetes bacterium]|nr:hypothetical protein [Armatimonadota bacterium]